MPSAYLRWNQLVREPAQRKSPAAAHHADAGRRRATATRGRPRGRAPALSTGCWGSTSTPPAHDLLLKIDRMTAWPPGSRFGSPSSRYRARRVRDAIAPGQAPRSFAVLEAGPQARGRRAPADEILSRPKHGFGVRSIGGSGAVGPYTAAMLGPKAHVRRRLNGAELDRMLAEHDARAQNHGHALWTLLTLELFLRRHGW